MKAEAEKYFVVRLWHAKNCELELSQERQISNNVVAPPNLRFYPMSAGSSHLVSQTDLRLS